MKPSCSPCTDRNDWLCLDEDAELGGTGTRCSQQCAECREREEEERSGIPPEDSDATNSHTNDNDNRRGK